MERQKVLIVSKDPTHPTTAGNRWGILLQAEMLEKLGCEVHFLYVEERALSALRKDEYSEALEQTKAYWKNRMHFFRVSKLEKAWFNLLYRLRIWFCHYQEGIDDSYPTGLSRYVRTLQKSFHFDICIVNYYYLTKLLTKSTIPHGAVFTHDYFAYKNLVVNRPILHLTAHSEAMAMQRAESIFAVQDEEYCYYRLLSPKSRVYNIYCLCDYHAQPVTGGHDILFLSSGNIFNINGISWFIDSVLPLIKERFHDARLLIGGSICPCLNQYKSREDVVLQGYVEDPFQFYAQADVAINPVSQGTGIKIKTIEAISYDKVVLVHPHSARGVFNPSQIPLFVCKSEAEWLIALSKVWDNSKEILLTKEADKAYIHELNTFVKKEYERFLLDAAKQ